MNAYLVSYFVNAGFTATHAETIAGSFRSKLFSKGDYFVREGSKSLQLGLIEAGQFQYFNISNKGEEQTTYIAMPHTFVASLLSFLSEVQARENIRALTDGKIWIIDKKDMLQLQQDLPTFKDFYTGLLEYQLCCIDESRFDLITLSAEQRYAKLLEKEPELLQQVPLQYIASILGITPRHLSRLRNKIL